MESNKIEKIFQDAVIKLNTGKSDRKWNLIDTGYGQKIYMEPYNGLTVKLEYDYQSSTVIVGIYDIDNEMEAGKSLFKSDELLDDFIVSLCAVNATALITTYNLVINQIKNKIFDMIMEEKDAKH